jgi:hypothetical protein
VHRKLGGAYSLILAAPAHEATLDLVVGGHGVGRFTALTTREHPNKSGRLVPVLPDWEVQGGPPVNLLFKGSARRTPRLRDFTDFAIQCLRDMDAHGGVAGMHPVATERPAWHVRGFGRASATVRRPRSPGPQAHTALTLARRDPEVCFWQTTNVRTDRRCQSTLSAVA